jgi:hypothetical protein
VTRTLQGTTAGVRRLVAIAGAIGVLLAGSAHATIRSYSATLESHWPATSELPLIGSASVALDDSTNELSWEVQWAGSTARRAQVTMVGPEAPCIDPDCCADAAPPIILDLADGTSTVDARGGELSGRLRLTPEQAEELGTNSDSWRVELRLWDKRGVQLQGALEVLVLPPGVWL